MYCTSCGKKQIENAKFCVACGKKLVTANDEPKQMNTPQSEILHNHPSTSEPTQDLSEEKLLKDYIGKEKENYYLEKWNKGKQSWNWAGFFLTFFWAGYRKMYSSIIAILVVFLIIDLITTIFSIDPTRFNTGLGIAVAVIFGMSGNTMYKETAQKKIKKLKSQYGQTSDLSTLVKNSGGASWKGFWISVGLIFAYAFISVGITLAADSLSSNDEESTPITTVTDNTDSTNDQEEIETQPSPEDTIKQEVTAAIDKNFRALKEKDVEAYMSTIYNSAETQEMYQQTENILIVSIDNYDIEYELGQIEFVSINEDEVQARYTQTSKLVNGDDSFQDNITTTLNTFRKQDGEWKYFNTVAEDVQYLESESQEASNSTSYVEAKGIYENSCMGCHGGDLEGTASAPPLSSIGSQYSQDEIQDIIRNGINGTSMLGGFVTEGEAEQLAQWLATLK